MTPEQFAKCREFASCYTTNSDMLGLASGMIGGLLDHIDTLTAERDALRHDMDRLSAADTEHCTALVAAEARALALEVALAAMFAVYEGVYDMAVPDRHQSEEAKRACDLAESTLSQPKVTP